MTLLQFPTESNSERILEIGQYLLKLCARVRCLVFLTRSVVCWCALCWFRYINNSSSWFPVFWQWIIKWFASVILILVCFAIIKLLCLFIILEQITLNTAIVIHLSKQWHLVIICGILYLCWNVQWIAGIGPSDSLHFSIYITNATYDNEQMLLLFCFY